MRLLRLGYICLFLLSALVIGCGGSGNGSSSNGGGSSSTVPTLSISTGASLRSAIVNVGYSNSLSAAGGTAPYTWSVSSGSLPAGLTLSSAGALSGTPTAAGSSTFTVQVTDSESTPQKATLQATLAVDSTLLITTTSLGAGQQGTAYPDTQFAVTGGTAPYTWSIGPTSSLPAGMKFSSTGILNGTPTKVGNTSISFVVTDALSQTSSVTLSLLISPTPGTPPTGTFAFMFTGTSPQGATTNQIAVVINGEFTATTDGTITGGYYDYNDATGSSKSSQKQAILSGGSITNGTDGLGKLVLKVSSGTMTFALATPASVATTSDQPIRMVEFDDVSGSGTRGSGVMKKSNPTAVTSDINGSYAFLFSGADANQLEKALIGSFQTDNISSIVGGNANSNEEGTPKNWGYISGGYSVDADGSGHGTFTMNLSGTNYHFSFYEVSPTELMVISSDPAASNFPLVSGWALQQSGAPYSTSSFPSQAVLQMNGLHPISTTSSVPDISLGIVTSNGSGALSYTYDEYNGTLSTGTTMSTTYTVNASTGRATPADSSKPFVYFIDSNRAFVLSADSSGSSGMLEAQTASTFTFTGDYLGGSLPLAASGVLNEAGLVEADSAGNISFTTNRSTSTGLVQYQNVNGTYSINNKGKVTVTSTDGITRIFYIISPTKAAYLTSDSGGYLGIFQQ